MKSLCSCLFSPRRASNPRDDASLRRFLADPAIARETSKPYLPKIRLCKVVKVYDGDTLTVAVPLFNGVFDPEWEVYYFNVRIRGIDAPEIKTKNVVEKALSLAARDALRALVMGESVYLENVSTEKYGRLLCDVVLKKDELCVCIDVGKWMLEKGHAVVYVGDTKTHIWT
jgi:endonuclease YncB( thermonuclease family)